MEAGRGSYLFVVVIGAGEGIDIDVVRPDRDDLGDARHLFDQDALDAETQGQHAHGTAVAGAYHLQLHYTSVAHVDDVHVTGVRVDVGAYFVQRLVDGVVEGSC